MFTFFLKLFGCCKMLLIRSSVKLLISLIGETISLEVQKLLSCMAENKVWRRPYVNWRGGGEAGIISHKQSILYVKPILNDSDEARGRSWIYFTFIFTILEVWRAVILVLKTILWGLLFGNLVPCVTAYRRTPRLLEIVT